MNKFSQETEITKDMSKFIYFFAFMHALTIFCIMCALLYFLLLLLILDTFRNMTPTFLLFDEFQKLFLQTKWTDLLYQMNVYSFS